MRAFNNGKPQLSSSDRTRNIGVRNIFADTKSKNAKPTNYDGSIVYDTVNKRINRYQNYETYRAVNYGYSLCVDCTGVCANGVPVPEIQTENNLFSKMKFDKTNDTLISVKHGNNNIHDYLDDNAANTNLAVFIDPNHILFGDSPCTTKSYLNFLQGLTGVDTTGNDTNQNYLRCMSFPNKVKL
jgi:hypothetical protein